MTIVGYCRVSTQDQNLDLQTDALKKAGCEKIFLERGSGANRDRPELKKALAFVRADDIFICWKLDRVARSVAHLIFVMDDLKNRKVGFKSLNDAIDTTTAAGNLMFQIIAAFAEFERNVIRERTMAGLAAAKARGRLGGRRLGTKKIDGKWVVPAEAAA
jgi:DNA invertase Pin-like site-specific DNA recombinase